jgi:hypothetical protein
MKNGYMSRVMVYNINNEQDRGFVAILEIKI